METNNQVIKQPLTLVGEVVSDKMDKTIVVKVTRTFKDTRFHKILHKAKKYKVHDEREEAKIGDIVEIIEGKRTSKTKFMYLGNILRKGSVIQ